MDPEVYDNDIKFLFAVFYPDISIFVDHFHFRIGKRILIQSAHGLIVFKNLVISPSRSTRVTFLTSLYFNTSRTAKPSPPPKIRIYRYFWPLTSPDAPTLHDNGIHL
jgi:hypothetical protein